MSLHPQIIDPVPEETACTARLALSKENPLVCLREELGTIYEDEQFAALFPHRGQPVEASWRLALVCVLQYLEGLSDRQAAEAVRCRLDWKYLLGLELSNPGFDFSALSEFRARLVQGQAAGLLLDTLLERCKQRGWLKERGKHLLALLLFPFTIKYNGRSKRCHAAPSQEIDGSILLFTAVCAQLWHPHHATVVPRTSY